MSASRLAEFTARAAAARHARSRCREVRICCGTGCLASGAARVADTFASELAARDLPIAIAWRHKRTGCHGFCDRGPLVSIEPEGILYTRVKATDVAAISERTLARGEVIERLLYRNPSDGQPIAHARDIPFYAGQHRVALRNIGRVDPADLADAIAHGAYAGLARVLGEMTPEAVIAEIERAGLRGRGGAGFPTARKWRAARAEPDEEKYVLGNGDEGDPGAFKDRSLMEGDPHAVIEGMLIGAYAVGARQGIIYVRDEYPLAVNHLTKAIEDARRAGLLGSDILGTGFACDLRVSRGGGAFICGESSALMRSLEGKVGEPRAKHVHATARGLFGRPTVLNNVETWAHVGAILAGGAEAFAALGTERSQGTKAFSLVGKVKNSGLVELPMGTTLRQIIFEMGGGILEERPFKAVQTGGPSGGCLPAACLDLPVDYERLAEAGSMMGSGGMIVMDDRTCMVDVARYFLRFLAEESCGKCAPCREGLQQMLRLFDELTIGHGTRATLARIETLADTMRLASLCELGRTATNPVLSTLRYFRDEYLAHIEARACPAGVCRAVTVYEIVPERCNGCQACLRACPAEAITGERKGVQAISAERCTACGACADACPSQAVRFRPRPLTDRRAA